MAATVGPSRATALPSAIEQMQSVVDGLRSRLSIPESVIVALVPDNPLLVSVERLTDDQETFVLNVEQAFLQILTEDEIQAVLAHELGHVWIFTHHPYLHTEALANRIALRVVSRDSLARVYDKVWRRRGVQVDLARFLGE